MKNTAAGIAAACAIITGAHTVDSADYEIIVNPTLTIERRGGDTSVHPRIDDGANAYRWIIAHGGSFELAEAISRHPRALLLTSVAYHESKFDLNALGAAGEIGAYQIIPADWGPVPTDPAGQTAKAARILDSLIKKHGSVYRGVRAYNGAGPQAEEYARRIFRHPLLAGKG